MYFSKKYDTYKKAKEYYIGLLTEQHINSPYRYITNTFNINDFKCLINVGGAEGIFALEYIEKVENIYI